MAQPTFGNYTALTTSTTATNKTDIVANLNKLKALYVGEGTAQKPASPEFGLIHPHQATQLRAEIDALIAVINASP